MRVAPGGGKGGDADGYSHSGGNALGQLSVYTGSRRKDAYKSWRKEVAAFRLAFQVPDEQMGPRVWLRLAGEAKDAVQHLDLDDLAVKGGVDLLLQALDDVFETEKCDMIDEAVNTFWTMRRSYGESMEAFINRMTQAQRMMEKEDPETTIGEKAYAVRLLKKAGLSHQEQQQVLSATNAEYDRDKIEVALRRLFKNIAATDLRSNRPGGRPKGKGKGDKGKGGKQFRRKPFGAHAAEEAESDEDDDEDALYGADDEDEDDSEDDPFGVLAAEEDSDSEGDPDMNDAMAAFQSAKKRLAAVKKNSNRGFSGGKGKGRGEPGSTEDKKKKSHCSSCGGKGHWHGDPECPDVKSGKVAPYKPKTGGKFGAHYVDWEFVSEQGDGPEAFRGHAGPDAEQNDTTTAASSGTQRAHAAGPISFTPLSVYAASTTRPEAKKEAPTAKATSKAQPKAKAKAKSKLQGPPEPIGRSKDEPTDAQRLCRHPASEKKLGMNQYCRWQNCQKCGVRLWTSRREESFVGMAECMGAEDGESETDDDLKEVQAEQEEIEEMIDMMGNLIEVYTSATEEVQEGAQQSLEETIEKVQQSCGTGIWDTGCRRTLAGSRWIRNYVTALSRLHYKAEWTATNEKFKFGNQGRLNSKKLWHLPIELYGKMGVLSVHEVPGDCPLLISEDSMEKLGVDLKLRKREIDIEDLDVKDAELPFHPRTGHPIAYILPTRVGGIGGEDKIEFVGEAAPERKTTLETIYDANWSELDHDEEDERPMRRGVRKRFAGLAEAGRKSAEKPRRKLKIMEVFTWTMMMSITAAGLGWHVLEPITRESGWDLRKREVQEKVFKYVAKEKPDVIVCAWPCTAFSSLQHLMKNREGQAEKIARQQEADTEFIEFARRLYKLQTGGADIFWEKTLGRRKHGRRHPVQRWQRRCTQRRRICAHMVCEIRNGTGRCASARA